MQSEAGADYDRRPCGVALRVAKRLQFPGSVRVSGAGDRVLAINELFRRREKEEECCGKAAATSTRAACAPQSIRRRGGGLNTHSRLRLRL